MTTPTPTGPSGPAGPGPGRNTITAPDLLAEADLLTARGLLAWALQMIDGDDFYRRSAAFHIEGALRDLAKIPASHRAGGPPVPGAGFTLPQPPEFAVGPKPPPPPPPPKPPRPSRTPIRT